jgi:hypothetical protein
MSIIDSGRQAFSSTLHIAVCIFHCAIVASLLDV